MQTMFTTNPFATLSASVSPTLMQAYVIVMILLVAGGTLLDVIHKKSGTYFFNNWRTVRKRRQATGWWRRDGVSRHPDRRGRGTYVR